MADVKMVNVSKHYYKNIVAVSDFNLEIKDKEFIVLVGPSGCGKSTVLRMIAGLEEITDGELYIDGLLANPLPPKDRDIAMVFQNYALYPTMTVYENIAFGIETRFSRQEVDERVRRAAEMLNLTPFLARKPKNLSGGQKQRVALGRAIVRNPKLFLMDEPLSNLDAKLRTQMRAELIRLHKSLEATTIYVTHDQTEAMTMADRIVVMRHGRIQQVGTPAEIFSDPANTFVASFIGIPSINLFPAILSKEGILVNGELHPVNFLSALKPYLGKQVLVGIRPDGIEVEKSGDGAGFPVTHVELLGAETLVFFLINGVQCAGEVRGMSDFRLNDRVKIKINQNKLLFFDPESEERIK
jgi:multiple sugar transport system ATP-binding protein